MDTQHRGGELFDRQLLLKRLLRKQAQTGAGGLHSGGLALAQLAEAVQQGLAELLHDLAAGAAHVAQGEHAEGFLAILAAVEQVVIDVGQGAVQRRPHPVQQVFLHGIEQRHVGGAGNRDGVRGGTEAHGGRKWQSGPTVNGSGKQDCNY